MKIGIIGLGLMGGSLGLALKDEKRWKRELSPSQKQSILAWILFFFLTVHQKEGP